MTKIEELPVKWRKHMCFDEDFLKEREEEERRLESERKQAQERLKAKLINLPKEEKEAVMEER